MIPKAAASAADAVCIDLEDAVAPSEKAASRAHVVQALRTLDFGARTRIVRINGIDTPYAYRDLVDVIEAAGDRVDLVMVPKVGGARDVVFVDMLLSQIEAHRGLPAPIGIEAQIESASGFVYLREIAAASPRLEALILGAGDYAASMKMPSSGIGEMDANDELYPGHRWHAVMHGIVAAARAHGLRCMDGPYSAYQDAAGYERACRIARAMGFDGKQCIHPGADGGRQHRLLADRRGDRGGRGAGRGVRRRRRGGAGRGDARRTDDRRCQPSDGPDDSRSSAPYLTRAV